MNPKVIFDLSILEKNIMTLKENCKRINFLFPVKCCKNEKVFNIIKKYNFGYDISNLNEYKTIKKYLTKEFVSVSGPKSYELDNVKYKNIHIIANNMSNYSLGKGIRVNLNNNKKFDTSRFGVDYTLLSEEFKSNITYVHFHNSDHKTKELCDEIIKEVGKIVKSFKNLTMIDIGGHLEDLSFEDGIKYLKRIEKIIPDNITIYAELGDFLFKNSGKLYGRVIDVRRDESIQYVTLNFSKMANQRWAYPVYTDKSKNKIKTIFLGCSCCETDSYLETYSKELSVGDEVVFTNISPYSYEWNTSFNGVSELEYIFS